MTVATVVIGPIRQKRSTRRYAQRGDKTIRVHSLKNSSLSMDHLTPHQYQVGANTPVISKDFSMKM